MEGGGTTRYGFPIRKWDEAREEMKRILRRLAREGRTIAYSELVMQIKAFTLEPDSHALAAMLGEVSEEEDTHGRGMLTVLVVHKSGDMRPGPGFNNLAQKLGQDTSDPERLWIEEFKLVTERAG